MAIEKKQRNNYDSDSEEDIKVSKNDFDLDGINYELTNVSIKKDYKVITDKHEIKKKDDEDSFLSYKELKELIESVTPCTRAELVCKHLKNKIIINNDTSYKYVKVTKSYKDITKKLTNTLLNEITHLLKDSVNNLSSKEKKKILNIRNYKNIFENSAVQKYLPQVVEELTNDDIVFDSYINEIHFQNGYYDFKLGLFKNRRLGKHFITNYIKYDYRESNTKTEEHIYNQLLKIYPNPEVLNSILDILGSALTGQAIRGSYLLFLLGRASAGKSTILDLTKHTVQCYVKQIKADTFAEGKNQDKIVNTYHKGSYIRITWLNEPKDRTFDGTFFKSWADGECNAEKLYQEGSHDFKHYSLTIFTANTMPRFKLDGGIKRRIRAYEHKSTFTNDESQVNEEENIYLADNDFKYNFEEDDDLKLGLFSLLAKHAHGWLKNNKKMNLPKEFEETTEMIVDSNDVIKDFIDGHLTITDDDKDRISKKVMLELFKQVYPHKHLDVSQLVTLLKEKGIKYNHSLKSKGVQGSYYNIKINEPEPEESQLTIEEQILSLENQKYGIEQLILKLKQQLPITKKDFDVPEEKPKKPTVINNDHLPISKTDFDIPEEKPKKSKTKTKVMKATTVYIDPDNGKQYECDGFELTDDGIDLF